MATTQESITGLDVRAFETQIRNRMASDPTFTDYNFEGAGLAAITRILAMYANQQGFMDNMMFGEAWLNTAAQRANAAQAAQFLSYTPHNYRAATVLVDIVITPYDVTTAPAQLVIDQKAKFAGQKDGAIYYFTVQTPTMATLTDGVYTFTGIQLLQGQWMSKSYTVEGSAINSYKIPSDAVDIDHMIVQTQESATAVDYLSYKKYQSPFDLGQNELLYFVEIDLDGLYQIEFGDGYVAAAVKDQNIVFVQYLVTDGLLGNDITAITAASSIGGFSSIAVTITSDRSAGGDDPETIESMRKLAPLGFEAEGAAVTEANYTSLLRGISSDVEDARSYGGDTLDPPRPGYTYIAAKPVNRTAFTAAEKAIFVAALQERNIGSITPVIVDPDMYYLNLTVRTYWDPTLTSLTSVQLQDLISKSISKWASGKIDSFGGLFDKQSLEYYVKSLEKSISSDIITVQYEKRFEPTPGVQASWWFYYNRSILTGSVTITGFKPVGAEVDYTYTIIDRNGTLWMRKQLTADGTSTFYDVSSVGVVDYANGIVKLDTFEVSRFDVGGVITRASPDTIDQNVTAQQNQLMAFNIINVVPEVRYVIRN